MCAERLNIIHRHLTSGTSKSGVKLLSAQEQQFSIIKDQEFQYTFNNSPLTYEQRCFYEENGYILIKNTINDDIIDECSQHFKDLCEGRADKGNMVLMRDISLAKKGAKGEYLYNKAQDIVYDDVFVKYIENQKLLDFVECFIGPNIKAMHSMLINKPPDSGMQTSRHPLHQDLYYFPFRPADRIVAAWTAMERINTSNGCLVVMPGSHKRAPGGVLLQHDYPEWEGGVNKAYHGILGCDNYETIPLIMEKGDTAFFHPLLIHGSGANITNGFRKAISCHYAACECDYIDVTGTLQEKIAKEIEEMGARKGYIITMKDAWQYRSKLVRGEEKTL